MKIEVNRTVYDVEHIGGKIYVNNRELTVKLTEDEIIVDGNIFHLDFAEDGEPSLKIIDGMTYVTSRSLSRHEFAKEVKIPISGKITDVFVEAGTEVKEGDVLAILQAMKMEIQIKAPRNAKVVGVKASKDQSVKVGDVLAIFE